MDELPDDSIHLMVTSPPYNVGKEYDENLTLTDYRGLLKRVFSELHRVLVPGGRVCVNVANLGRKVGHPAPFPVELPYRLIQLYAFEKKVILDPFNWKRYYMYRCTKNQQILC